MALAFLFLGPWLIDLMTTAPEVRAEARGYLPWIAAAPIVGIAAWMLDGIFIGATETRAMRNAMILSVAVYACAVALLLPRVRQPRPLGGADDPERRPRPDARHALPRARGPRFLPAPG